MSKIGTLFLLFAVIAIGLVALYATVNAGSVPFATQMATMTLWAAAFALFIARRAARGP